MKKELQIFLSALVYYTRIPIGQIFKNQEFTNNKNIKYFTLVGWIVGALGALLCYLILLLDPDLKYLSILIGIFATILLTGALHEDGLADFFDGFGGGWEKETILKIMKDPRIGAFGVLGLIGVLSFKFIALSELSILIIPLVLLGGQTISRTSIYILTETLSYESIASSSKSNTIFNNSLRLPELLLAILIGLLPLILLWSYGSLIIIAGQIVVTLIFRSYIKKWLGGFNGDCLGACQQLNEMFFYLQVLILIKLDLLECKFILLDILDLM